MGTLTWSYKDVYTVIRKSASANFDFQRKGLFLTRNTRKSRKEANFASMCRNFEKNILCALWREFFRLSYEEFRESEQPTFYASATAIILCCEISEDLPFIVSQSAAHRSPLAVSEGSSTHILSFWRRELVRIRSYRTKSRYTALHSQGGLKNSFHLEWLKVFQYHCKNLKL